MNGTGEQEGRWDFFDDTAGLAHACVCLLEDADGSIWCGSWFGGVSRYDGRRIVSFTTKDGLAHDRVTCMVKDGKGGLWIGTHGGLSRYDGKGFRSFTVAEGLANSCVLCLSVDASGNVWAGTDSGLSRCDGDRVFSFLARDGLPAGAVHHLLHDRAGNLWIAVENGICRYDGKRFAVLGSEDGWVSDRALCLLEDRAGNIWAGKLSTGLCRYDGTRVTNFTAADGFPDRRVCCLLEDRAGNIWMGTGRSGVIRYDGAHFTRVGHRTGADYHHVWCLLEDGRGSIWAAASGEGVSRYDGDRTVSFGARGGAIGTSIRHAIEDREGCIWFASFHGGVSRYNPFYAARISDESVEEVMIRDRKGRFWWGSRRTVTSYDGSSFAHHKVDGDVWELFEDAKGCFWISTSASLRRYDSADSVGSDRFRTFSVDDGLPAAAVVRICEDSRGHIWLGTGRGLYGYDGERFFESGGGTREFVSAVCEDGSGLLWLGGWAAHGISAFDGKSLRSHYTAADGLPEGSTQCLITDDARNLWIGTSHGLSRFDGRSFRNYGIADGLLGQFVQRMIRDSRGTIWIATLGGGIGRFDGECFQVLTVADGLPSNSVTGIIEQADGTMMISTYGGVCRYTPDYATQPLIRIHGVNAAGSKMGQGSVSAPAGVAVTIGYRSVSSRTRRMRYMYILEGRDSEWKATWNDEVRYDGLSVGKYVFKVKAISRDMVRSEPAELIVEVVPDPREQRLGELEEAVRDKTVRLQSALEYSENILRVMTDALIVVSPEGAVLGANPAACALLKYTADELLGKPLTAIVAGGDLPEDSLLPDGSGSTLKSERMLVAKDGTRVPTLLSRSAMKDARGAVAGIVCVAQDLTERRRMEQRMIQHERLSAFGQMASGVAHNFNNALVPVVGFSELLLNDSRYLDDRQKALGMIKDIHEAAKQAATTVRRLRDFYRPISTTEFASLDMNAVIERVVALTRPKWDMEMESRGIPISVKTDLHDVPSVLGSEPQLCEALTNLVLNAVDAMPTGGTIVLRTGVRGREMTVEVADSGTGMTEEVQQHCFDPFFTTKGGGGTGIGLSVVFGIIKGHGGQIEVQSQLGKGTTFRIHLPVEVPLPAGLEPRAPAKLTRHLRILIVDDEEWTRKVMVHCLEPAGHSVAVACTGQEGLDLFGKGQYDVVIVDRAMPGMSGDALALAIKKQSPNTPVVMVSGFGDLMRGTGEHPEGVDEIVSKPMKRSDLLDAIARVVR